MYHTDNSDFYLVTVPQPILKGKGGSTHQSIQQYFILPDQGMYAMGQGAYYMTMFHPKHTSLYSLSPFHRVFPTTRRTKSILTIVVNPFLFSTFRTRIDIYSQALRSTYSHGIDRF
jgi:hypothetical protein